MPLEIRKTTAIWLSICVAILVITCIGLVISVIDLNERVRDQSVAIRNLTENHARLLENHKSLHDNLSGLAGQTKSTFQALNERISAETKEVPVLTKKLENLTGFRIKGEYIMPYLDRLEK